MENDLKSHLIHPKPAALFVILNSKEDDGWLKGPQRVHSLKTCISFLRSMDKYGSSCDLMISIFELQKRVKLLSLSHQQRKKTLRACLCQQNKLSLLHQ